jgi:hypothetical protein
VTMLETTLRHWEQIALWGLVSTAVMTTILEGAQQLGVTRLSLPFLFGTFVTGSRRAAVISGYVLYLLGGWLFAILYALVLDGLWPTWWFGAVIGLVHGLFLVAVFLPLLPYMHPRIATEYDGPSALRRLEPPGSFGLNYGRATPVSTVLAQATYGLIFATGYTHG